MKCHTPHMNMVFLLCEVAKEKHTPQYAFSQSVCESWIKYCFHEKVVSQNLQEHGFSAVCVCTRC